MIQLKGIIKAQGENMQKSMTDTQRDKIVDDLLSKFPSGPRGVLTKDNYDMDMRHSNAANVYRLTAVCEEKYFGYDEDILMQVFWRMSEGNIREYIRSRWTDIGSRAISRRYNILSDRLDRAVNRFRRQNARGIWEVTYYPKNIKLYVMASSSDTSRMLARTMLAGCGIIVEEQRFYSSRVNVDCPSTLKHYTDRNFETVKHSIKHSIEKLEDLKAKIESLNNLKTVLETFGDVQHEML